MVVVVVFYVISVFFLNDDRHLNFKDILSLIENLFNLKHSMLYRYILNYSIFICKVYSQSMSSFLLAAG